MIWSDANSLFLPFGRQGLRCSLEFVSRATAALCVILFAVFLVGNNAEASDPTAGLYDELTFGIGINSGSGGGGNSSFGSGGATFSAAGDTSYRGGDSVSGRTVGPDNGVLEFGKNGPEAVRQAAAAVATPLLGTPVGQAIADQLTNGTEHPAVVVARDDATAVGEWYGTHQLGVIEVPTNTAGEPFQLPPELGGSSHDLEAGEEQEGTDPVHPGRGDFRYTQTDLTLPGVGLNFKLERTYRSRFNFRGPLGTGWNHTYNQRLLFEESSCGQRVVFWQTGHASLVRFEEQAAVGWFTSSTPWEMRSYSSEDWVITSPTGIEYQFDGQGHLVTIIDQNGNSLELEWGPQRSSSGAEEYLVTKVTDTVGREVEFTYDGLMLDRVTVLGESLDVNYEV